MVGQNTIAPQTWQHSDLCVSVRSPCYQVMMLDIAVDDTDGRVTCVTGLRHLSTAELTKLAGTENLGKGLDFHLPMHLMKAQPEVGKFGETQSLVNTSRRNAHDYLIKRKVPSRKLLMFSKQWGREKHSKFCMLLSTLHSDQNSCMLIEKRIQTAFALRTMR